MSQLIWSPRSGRDLAEIDAYLSDRDPAAAVQMLRAIRASAARLADFPRLGRPFTQPFRVIGVRKTPYLILYRLHGGAIEIVRIRHARQDWSGAIEAEL